LLPYLAWSVAKNLRRIEKMKLRMVIAAAVACCALAVPSLAVAEVSPTQDAYSGVAGEQQSSSGGGPTSGAGQVQVVDAAVPAAGEASVEASSGGTLPFTGLELGVIVLVAAGLIGGGAVLYRVSRRQHPLA
jgi:hypothetical protein